MPRCVLMLAYRAVPVKFLFSRYGICWCVFESRYFFASPKSMTYTRLPFLPRPIRKLSGFISRWIKFFECMYSMRLICNKTTVCFSFLLVLRLLTLQLLLPLLLRLLPVLTQSTCFPRVTPGQVKHQKENL